jgi:hypothetical protein
MKSSKALIWLSALIAVLVLVAAAAGVFSQTPGAHISFVTVRGEHAIYQGSGLYRYDPVSVAREGVVWDVIDLCLALPLFALAIVLGQRNALRGRLLLGGMLFYFVYKYLMYAVMVAFNPLFLVYVAIFALSALAFFLNLRGIEVSRLPAHIAARFPRRLFIGFALVMSAALVILWLGRIIPYTLADRFPDEFGGLTTLVTQAFDLGMVVPLLLTTAILLWRRSAWGYLMAGISRAFLLECAGGGTNALTWRNGARLTDEARHDSQPTALMLGAASSAIRCFKVSDGSLFHRSRATVIFLCFLCLLM